MGGGGGGGLYGIHVRVFPANVASDGGGGVLVFKLAHVGDVWSWSCLLRRAERGRIEGPSSLCPVVLPSQTSTQSNVMQHGCCRFHA